MKIVLNHGKLEINIPGVYLIGNAIPTAYLNSFRWVSLEVNMKVTNLSED